MSDASLGLLPIVLITSFLVIGATASSILIKNQTTTADAFDKAVTDITDDITTYLKVQQIIGKFNNTDIKPSVQPSIQRLAINVRPLISGTIDLTKIKIELIFKDDVTILSYQDTTKTPTTGTLFTNKIWDQLTAGSFTMLVTVDDDSSVLTTHSLNKNTDAGFLLVKLPQKIYLHPYDECQLVLMPTPGEPRSFTLDIPYTTSSLVILYG